MLLSTFNVCCPLFHIGHVCVLKGEITDTRYKYWKLDIHISFVIKYNTNFKVDSETCCLYESRMFRKAYSGVENLKTKTE